MKRSTAYRVVAIGDAIAAVYYAFKGDAFFIAFFFLAGFIWAAGNYWKSEEDNQGE